MKTIALRFADNYAPADGTIKLHEDVINEFTKLKHTLEEYANILKYD